MFPRAFAHDPTFELFDALRREVDRFLDHGDASPVARAAPLSAGTWPALAVRETADAIVVRAEVPGLAEGDVVVELHDGVLTVRGERATPAREGYETLRRERPALAFERAVRLGPHLDAARAEATVRDGVLEVHVPRAAEAKPRRIQVRGQA